MIREAVWNGLKGFLPIRDNRYIRPLIEASRDEILAFVSMSGARAFARTTPMRARSIWRNRVSLELIPFLRKNTIPEWSRRWRGRRKLSAGTTRLSTAASRRSYARRKFKKRSRKFLFPLRIFRLYMKRVIYRVFKVLLESLAPKTGGFFILPSCGAGRPAQRAKDGKEAQPALWSFRPQRVRSHRPCRRTGRKNLRLRISADDSRRG